KGFAWAVPLENVGRDERAVRIAPRGQGGVREVNTQRLSEDSEDARRPAGPAPEIADRRRGLVSDVRKNVEDGGDAAQIELIAERKSVPPLGVIALLFSSTRRQFNPTLVSAATRFSGCLSRWTRMQNAGEQWRYSRVASK